MSRPKKPRNPPLQQYTLEETERLQRQQDEETAAFFRAWLKKYGSSRVSVELAPQAGFGPPIRR